jgi:hypothetical protein
VAQVQPNTGQAPASSDLEDFFGERDFTFWSEQFNGPLECIVLQAGPADIVKMPAWKHVNSSAHGARSRSLQGSHLVQHVGSLCFEPL